MADDRLEVRSEWKTIPTDDGEMRAYVAAATAQPRSVVVVLQEAFGVNAHIQSIANRLAASGFLAIAPDLFHRSSDGVVEYSDKERGMSLISELGPEAIATDVGAAVAFADGEAGELPVSVLGFCFGGRAAFTAACLVEGLDSVVVFYGPGVAAGPFAMLDRADGIDARMLLFNGAEDPTISADDRAATERALDEAGVEYQSRVYEDAGHAFFCDARPPLFRAGPALDAWTRTLGFLPG